VADPGNRLVAVKAHAIENLGVADDLGMSQSGPRSVSGTPSLPPADPSPGNQLHSSSSTAPHVSTSPRRGCVRVTPRHDGRRLRLVFGMSAAHEGRGGRELPTNLTVILVTGAVGLFGTTALAAYGISSRLDYVMIPILFGICTATLTMVGVNIGEDIWYPVGPSTMQTAQGAEVIVNINASPYHCGKRGFRRRMLATRAADEATIMCYVNLVGGQDELVFEGNSMIFDAQGELLAEASQFSEDLLIADLDIDAVFRARLHDPKRRQRRPMDTRAQQSI